MTRFALALVLCGLAALAVPALAQEQQTYSPPPMGPNQFADPAMSFTAPAGFLKLQIPPHDPVQFGDPTLVAAFVFHPGKGDMRAISIQMENFQGTLDGYEMVSENELRNKSDSVFFKHKVTTTLSNGMPAYFQNITIGSGFDENKIYRYVWIDGVRGIQLAESARFGELSEDQAKKDLANASATAYPVNRY